MSETVVFEFEPNGDDEGGGLFSETVSSAARRIASLFGFDAAEIKMLEMDSLGAFCSGASDFFAATGARFYADGGFWRTDFETVERICDLDMENERKMAGNE